MKKSTNRRNFIKETALGSAALFSVPLITEARTRFEKEEGLYMIGPREGYSPRVGTLLSTMEMMREWVKGSVKDLSVEQLDFQLDDQANTIGSILLLPHFSAELHSYYYSSCLFPDKVLFVHLFPNVSSHQRRQGLLA